MLLGFNEGDLRSRLLALLLTLRFRTDKTFVADASLSRRAKLPVGERRAASSAKGTKAKCVTSCDNAFVTNIVLASGSRLSRFPTGVE